MRVDELLLPLSAIKWAGQSNHVCVVDTVIYNIYIGI